MGVIDRSGHWSPAAVVVVREGCCFPGSERGLSSTGAMDAIDLLTQHHRQLERQMEALKGAEVVDEAEFARAADEFVMHVTVEETLFYPAVKARRTEDILLESLEEHLSLKRVLADLLAIAPGDAKFGPKLHVLAEQLAHHHEEEEEHLFPKVRKVLGGDDLAALGDEMEERMRALAAAGGARRRVLVQTVDSAPLV